MLQLPETIVRPTGRQLRQFAGVLPLAVLAMGWALQLSTTQLLSACLASAAIALVGWWFPGAVKPIYVGVSLLAYPVGVVVSELVMLAVYFGLITPIALFFRLTQRDALERTIDRNTATYWRVKQQPASPASYLRRW